MHDPMVVAFRIPAPMPKRVTWRERGGRRWGFDVSRRTNPQNLGERTYPWWRPRGYTLRLAGRAYGLREAVTIWHVEPGGRDAFSVCAEWKDGRRARGWKWHVHHWHLQIHLLGKLKRFLFERCIECGRRYPWGYAPVSHQWEEPAGRWFRVERRAYHHECSSLDSLRTQKAVDEAIIRHLAATAGPPQGSS